MGVKYTSVIMFLLKEKGIDEVSLRIGDADIPIIDIGIDHKEIFKRFLAVVVPAMSEEVGCKIAD